MCAYVLHYKTLSNSAKFITFTSDKRARKNHTDQFILLQTQTLEVVLLVLNTVENNENLTACT